MRWKRYRIVIVISALLFINIFLYRLTKAEKTNPTTIPEIVPFRQPDFQKSHPSRVVKKAQELCNKYKSEGLTLPILMGIMEVESGFNPKAVSKDLPMSYGLMQVLRTTASPILKELGHKWSLVTILDPEINMEVGVEHLMNIHKHFVSLGVEGIDEFHVTIIAYNRGEQAVRDSLKTGSLQYLGKIKVASRKY